MRSNELTPSLDPTDYYFSIQRDLNGDVSVVMTRRTYWDAERHLQDTAGPSGPDRVASAVGLQRLMDSTFEVPKAYREKLQGLKRLKEFLESKGFEWNPDLSNFAGIKVAVD